MSRNDRTSIIGSEVLKSRSMRVGGTSFTPATSTTTSAAAGGGGGNRSRLPSNASLFDPDTIGDLDDNDDNDVAKPINAKMRTSSGTNLSGPNRSSSGSVGSSGSRMSDLRKKRYSYGDGSHPSDSAYSLRAGLGSFTTSSASPTATMSSSSIEYSFGSAVSSSSNSKLNTGSGSSTNPYSPDYSGNKDSPVKNAAENPKLMEILLAREKKLKKHTGRSMDDILKNPTSMIDGHTSNYMSMISNFILIGGREDAANKTDLLEYGVTHILNCAQQVPNFFENDFIYGNISILDDEKVEIKPFVEQILRFLGEVEQCRGRCLVHCVAGVSRSVTAVIIYFMHRHRMCLRHSFDYIKSCRPFICPNEGFKVKLAVMETDLFGYSTVSRKAGKVWEFYSFNEVKNSFTYKDPSTIVGDKVKSSSCLVS